MATIGTFTEKDGKISGKIHTLTINANVNFLPNTSQNSPDAPAYRVFAGKMEVGAAWAKTSTNSGQDYHSVKLDDPSFPAPVYASLVTDDEGGYALIWSRPTRQS